MSDIVPLYALGSSSPISMHIFSGCDTLVYIDGKEYPTTLGLKFTRDTLRLTVALTSGLESLLYSDSYKKFHLVSANESDALGIIEGFCKVKDFDLDLSIDSLNFEVVISLESRIKKVLGHYFTNPKEQEEIKKIVHELRANNKGEK